MAEQSGILSRLKAILFFIVFYVVFILVHLTRIMLIPVSRSNLHLSSKRPKILYLATFFPNNAGYHYRVKLWADILKSNGYKVTIRNVYTEHQFHHLRKKNPPHVMFYLRGMVKRYVHVLESMFYHLVIVRREILHFNDYGNLFFEKFLLSIHPNAILDFDDDIAEAKKEPKKISLYGRLMLEHAEKFKASVQQYHFFITGSRYLKEYVMKLHAWIKPHQILVLPTSVNYSQYAPKKYDENKRRLNLGWIGSNNNQQYLHLIEHDLERLAEKHDIVLHVISGKPFVTDKKFEVINHPWSIETEIESLLKIDIGLMPLKDNKLQAGKCGFKLIQYMGLGIVGVASAIGANKEIVTNGENGFLIPPGNTWYDVLNQLASNPSQLAQLGANARETINLAYSISGNRDSFVHYINTLNADEF